MAEDESNIEGEEGLDSSGQRLIFRRKGPARQSTTDDADRQPRKKKSQFDSKVGQQQLQRALYGLFKAATVPLRSTAEFDEDDFEESSKDLVDLVNRVFFLRIFFNIIAPVAGVVTLKDKIQRLVEGRRQKGKPNLYAVEEQQTVAG